MRARWLGALAALVALTAGGAPPAAAKPGYTVQERTLQLTLHPDASNGYRVTIETEGHRRVTLTARRGSASVTYRTLGQVDRRGIDATFGGLGRVSVRFEGERRPFPGLLPPALAAKLENLDFLRRNCHGPKPIREVGSFHGTIAFEGENGFTEVRARRAGGEVERFYTRVCEQFPGSAGEPIDGDAAPAGEDFKVSLLYAADESPGRMVGMEALGFELEGLAKELFGSLYVVGAKVVERRESMLIVRSAAELADATSVWLSPPRRSPASGRVALSPFNGSARYRKERGVPPRWSGSLAVRLPGAGLVPLTGPGFSAALCHFHLRDLLSNRCLRRADLPLPGQVKAGPSLAARPGALGRILAQGSGSQSHAFWDERLSWSR
jgi:hypothetical protein